MFNPCGHVASKEACEYWTRLPQYPRVESGLTETGQQHGKEASTQLSPACPFCGVSLCCDAPVEMPVEAEEVGDVYLRVYICILYICILYIVYCTGYALYMKCSLYTTMHLRPTRYTRYMTHRDSFSEVVY